MNTSLDDILNDAALSENFAEAFITDVMSQLDILDPSEEAEEIIGLLSALTETKPGLNFLAYLVGVDDFSDYLSELDCLENFDGGYTPSTFPDDDDEDDNELTMFDDEQGQED